MWIRSIFQGFQDARKHSTKDWQYQTIANSPVLYSSGFLRQKTEQANTKEQLECILENMYRHDALFIRDDEGTITDVVPSYKQLEQEIIRKGWGS